MCVKETVTQHHQGAGHGHGCVADSEILVFAVFATTKVETANGVKRLAKTAFRSNDLKRGNISLARQGYTTLRTFNTAVVAPREASGETFEGIVFCHASVLRGLTMPVPRSRPQTMRAVCVLDKVEIGDHDGHAALEYCEEQARYITNPNTLGQLRVAVGYDIAAAFSALCDPAKVLPP